jgi:MFS transporter, FSR family, fosmidomycin resistance protein
MTGHGHESSPATAPPVARAADATKHRPTLPAAEGALDRGGMALLGSGHFVVDMTVGALAPLVPLFTSSFDLSDLQASMILGASTFSSSAIQPLFGWLADRRPASWLLWGGVSVAAALFALAGFAGGYLVLLACIVGSGIGVAAYHPEAARVAHALAGDRKATGVAWFMTGGNLGFAVGPLITALFIPLAGTRATLAILVPGAIVAAVLLAQIRRVALPLIPVSARRAATGGPHGPGFALLVVVTTMRTWTQFGLLLLVPLILTEERGWSDRAAGAALFAYTGGMVLGTIGGSILADRIGGRRMLVVTMPIAAPLVLGFLYAPSPVGVVLLGLCGAAAMASMSVTVVMGQAYMPHRMALAAGLMIGFASIGVATLGLALVGAVADAAGRDSAMWAVAAFPLVGAALAALLPLPRSRTVPALA